MISNLINNSIKFTPDKGEIKLEAKLKTVEDNKKELVVSVTDSGIGIADEDMPKLFQRFQQVGEAIVKDIGGTGLGLYISKELVELHGGTIWCESELGKWTKFTFTISPSLITFTFTFGGGFLLPLNHNSLLK